MKENKNISRVVKLTKLFQKIDGQEQYQYKINQIFLESSKIHVFYH